jgi:hypothetical protein
MIAKTGRIATAALAAALGTGTLAGCVGPSTTATASASQSSVVTVTTSGAAVASTTAGGSNGGGGGVSTGGPTAAGVPQCVTSNVVAAVYVVPGSQGAGHESLNLTLTNISGHSCTVYGFPGLQLMAENAQDQPGADQPTTTNWDPAVPKTLVTLADSGSASTTIQFDMDVPGVGEQTSGPCEPDSYYLAIIPPNNTTAVTARIGGPNSVTGITVCEQGRLQVLPFVAGGTGANQ